MIEVGIGRGECPFDSFYGQVVFEVGVIYDLDVIVVGQKTLADCPTEDPKNPGS